MSIIKNVTLQKIVAHDFRYDPRMYVNFEFKGVQNYEFIKLLKEMFMSLTNNVNKQFMH